MRGLCAAIVLVTVCASAASAQRRGYVTEPNVWVSGGAGGFTAEQVNDGNSGSTWNFGNSANWQWAAGVEKNIGSGSSLGIAATYAHAPFAYVSFAQPTTSGATCPGNCDAHMDLTTLVGTFHFGAGTGFHQTIQFDGGIVNYANLKRDSDGVRLAGGNNTDPFFTIGYGLGYGFNEKTQLEFIPVWGIAIHERSGLSNGVSNTNSIRSLRVSLRMGFGGRTYRR